jgi:uncharacterized protein YqjF (DUF2071 family)
MKPFLTADWRYLVMVNYTVDPAILAPLVPAGTELDYFENRTFLSLVGFLFLNTRVLGLAVPMHRDFEEVNLRFYVRRKSADGWRRGVVFVRELVPRQAIATVARVFYGENYSALPMRHHVVDNETGVSVEYGWRRGKKWETLSATASGLAQIVPAGSHVEFITEHYWGYTAGKKTSEYRVEHPRWKIWPATSASLVAEVATLYGEPFVAPLQAAPVSQFIAEGSHVQVFRKFDDPKMAQALAERRA